jgi:hypothetical protein
MKMKIKKMLKVLGIVGLSACLFVGNPCRADITRATINLQDPNDPMRVANSDAFYAVDVFDSGTNTSNNHVIQHTGIDTIVVAVQVGSVSVGSIGFGIEQSLDNDTWGSVTACQMVQLTNTLLTTAAATTASSTGYWQAGDYFGTNTQYIGGTSTTYGSQSGVTGAQGSTTICVLRTVGDFLRIRCTHTLSATDTARYKVVLKKITKGKI